MEDKTIKDTSSFFKPRVFRISLTLIKIQNDEIAVCKNVSGHRFKKKILF